MTNAIEMSGVKKYFGNIRAVDGLSLAIPAGRVVGFLGLNGAGDDDRHATHGGTYPG